MLKDAVICNDFYFMFAPTPLWLDVPGSFGSNPFIAHARVSIINLLFGLVSLIVFSKNGFQTFGSFGSHSLAYGQDHSK